MAEFVIQIAGQRARISSLFESTRHYCARYLAEGEGDIVLTVTPEDLEKEQQLLLEEALREKIRPRVFPEPFLERSVIQRKLSQALLSRDILLMHGSAVAVDGKGYLFTANCGTGKSTHTRLWRKVFGDRAVMVNDDKPFLRISREGVLVCGAPWSGKHGLDANVEVPLQGICILERGLKNEIRPISPREGLPWLMRQGGAPEEDGELETYQTLVKILSEGVPLWRMNCNREEQAAWVSWEAMSQIR